MTDNTSDGWYVLGWRAEVRYEKGVYTATVREHPQIVTFGSTRSEALAQLQEQLAVKVGPAPGSVEKVN